jgi:hypothetical protein
MFRKTSRLIIAAAFLGCCFPRVLSAPLRHKPNLNDMVSKAKVVQFVRHAVLWRESGPGLPTCRIDYVVYMPSEKQWVAGIFVMHVIGHTKMGKTIFSGEAGDRRVFLSRYGKLLHYDIGD